MRSSTPHPEWFKPLFAELDRLEAPYVALHAAEHAYDPDERDVPYSLVVNRMSPSAWMRGHREAIFHALRYLPFGFLTDPRMSYLLEVHEVSEEAYQPRPLERFLIALFGLDDPSLEVAVVGIFWRRTRWRPA